MDNNYNDYTPGTMHTMEQAGAWEPPTPPQGWQMPPPPTKKQLDKQQLKRTATRVGWMLFLLMLISQIGASIFMSMVGTGTVMSSGWLLWMANYIPLYLVALPLSVLVIRKLPKQAPVKTREVSLGQTVQLIFIGLGVTYIVNFFSIFITFLIGQLKGSEVVNPLAAMTTEFLPTLIFVCIIAPIMEEIIFRKLLLERLLPLGEGIAVFGTAFLFAIFHGNFSQMFYAFALGVIFAMVTLRTGGIRLSIILHLVVNITGSLLVPGLYDILPEATADIATYAIVAVFIILGFVFWRRMPKERTVPSTMDLSPKEQRRGFLGNGGMIAYMILMGIIVLIMTMADVIMQMAATVS